MSGLTMRKRQKLVLTTLVLACGLVAVQSAGIDVKYIFVVVLALLNWVLASWALRDGLSGIEWLTVPLPPVAFTVAIALFYVLLPQEIWARTLIILAYTIGQYALLLTANIFSVAAIRTIALFRAATAVGFVMTVLTGFLLYDTILSFRVPFWLIGLLVAITSWFLLLPAVWSVKLENKLTKPVITFSIWLALMVGFLAAAISFWPISLVVSSLFLSTALYVFLGISQHHFQDRLFNKTIWEYVVVGMVVLVSMLVTSGIGH